MMNLSNHKHILLLTLLADIDVELAAVAANGQSNERTITSGRSTRYLPSGRSHKKYCRTITINFRIFVVFFPQARFSNGHFSVTKDLLLLQAVYSGLAAIGDSDQTNTVVKPL